MDQHENLFIERKWGNKTQFKGGSITITVERFFYKDGKHQITEPETAKAHFTCDGQKYYVENVGGVSNVEDWYWGVLLPKMQMLSLLGTLMPVQELAL